MNHILLLACALSLVAGCDGRHGEIHANASDPEPQGQVMKIHFERSGGVGGMMTQVDIDARSLEDTERRALTTLVSDAGFFALPQRAIERPVAGADRFNYRVTVESDDRRHTVETTDGSAPAALVPLIEWLNDAARRAQRAHLTKP